MTPLRGILLDRDGIVNERIVDGYVRFPDELVLIDGILPVLTWAFDKGIIVSIVTNQQGVGKGVMSLEDLDVVHAALNRILADRIGRTVHGIYECTSLASENDPRRKPQPGMLIEAMEDFGLLPSTCVMIGDSVSDAEAGKAAGTLSLLLGAFDQNLADKVVGKHDEIVPALESMFLI